MIFKDLNFKSEFFLATAFSLFGIIPLVPSKAIPTLTGFALLLIIIHSLKLKKIKSKKSLFLLNSSLFLILLITLKDNFNFLTLKKLEQMCSLLIFPLVFYFFQREDNYKIWLGFELWKKIFMFSSVLYVFVCFYLAYKYINPKYPNFDANFFRQAILESTYFSRDPVYISLYLNIAIFFCIDFFLRAVKPIYKFLHILFIFILLSLVFVLQVKMAIIALVVCVTILLFLQLELRKFLITTFIIVILPLILVTQSNSMKFNRFSELFSTNSLSENTQYNSVFVHKQTIICALEVFKSHFFLGVGLENSNSYLDSCVRSIYKHNKDVVYNSHNQYLSYALHSGILGFILIIIVLFIALKQSFKNDYFLFVILLYFCISFFTENILERQPGLILFAFLLNITPNIRTKVAKSLMSN
jgi:O-antigen ligase